MTENVVNKKEADVQQKIVEKKVKKMPTWKNYGRYVINTAVYSRSQFDFIWEQINSLTTAVDRLQKENIELKASLKGGA